MRQSALAVLCLAAIASANVVSAADSDLVALAKRTNRKASTRPVITNETLVRSSARVSQSPGAATQAAFYPAAQSTPQPWPTPQPQSTPQPQPTPQAQPTPGAVPAAYARPADTATVPTTARFTEAQSSVRFVNPASTAASTNVTSTVQSGPVQSSVQWAQPASSARSVPIP